MVSLIHKYMCKSVLRVGKKRVLGLAAEIDLHQSFPRLIGPLARVYILRSHQGKSNR
jgi:hypothetical protein